MILSNVCKRYGEKTVLKQIDLTIEEGKITAVLGESGAGKTTLLRIMAGTLSYEGEVDGKRGETCKRREKCSYLFQDCMLLPNLSAKENCEFVLPKERWREVSPMLARVGLGGRENAYPRELSGGERQRVAIARAFLFPHDLLLMDEPFSSLDLAIKKSLIGLVYELWQEKGSTVVFVTHDVREAALLSHRALVLKGGEIALDLPVPAPFPRDFLSPPEEENALVRALL